jgi:hypothetical protein
VGLTFVGLGHAMAFTSLTALLQRIVSDDFRGRVFSMHTLAHLGSRPLTALVAGALATTIGVVATIGTFLIAVPFGVTATLATMQARRQVIDRSDDAHHDVSPV